MSPNGMSRSARKRSRTYRHIVAAAAPYPGARLRVLGDYRFLHFRLVLPPVGQRPHRRSHFDAADPHRHAHALGARRDDQAAVMRWHQRKVIPQACAGFARLGAIPNPSAEPPMIDLYVWPTPNGYKISIMLEEIAMAYNVIDIDIQARRPVPAGLPEDQPEQQDAGHRRQRRAGRQADRHLRDPAPSCSTWPRKAASSCRRTCAGATT